MNYLLVVQQEMRNDNKLGKEKQKNKQMVSHPLVHFKLFLFLLSFLGGSQLCHAVDKYQRTCPFKDSGREWNHHFNWLMSVTFTIKTVALLIGELC